MHFWCYLGTQDSVPFATTPHKVIPQEKLYRKDFVCLSPKSQTKITLSSKLI